MRRIAIELMAAAVLCTMPVTLRADALPEDACVSGRVTSDPIGEAFVCIYNHYMAETIYYWPPELLVVPYDLNHDGHFDLMISANYFENGRAGQMWHIYLRKEQGFRLLAAMVTFEYQSALLVPEPSASATSILAPQTGGGGKAALVETRITEKDIVERLRRRYQWDKREDSFHWEKLRQSHEALLPLVKRMNFGPLEGRYGRHLKRDIRKSSSRFDPTKPERSIDFRNPEYAESFVDSVDAMYDLVDGKAIRGGGDSLDTKDKALETD